MQRVIYSEAVPIVLILLFLLLPIAELYVIIQVAGAIGIWLTLGLLVLDGILGATLARTQGQTAWRKFNDSVSSGKIPAKETFDGVAIVFGGALLLSPGFITDIFGFILLIPPSRAAVRRLMIAGAKRFTPARSFFFVYDRWPGRGPGGPADPRRPGGTAGPGAGPPYDNGAGGSPPPANRGYDIDGDAREIADDPRELKPGEG